MVGPVPFHRSPFLSLLTLVSHRRLLKLDRSLRPYLLFDFVQLQILFVGLVEELQKGLLVRNNLAIYWGFLDVSAFELLVLGYTVEQPVEDQIVVNMVTGLNFS